ncbi:MAG: NfeD family protein [Prevotellaceae bacterium]|jgi:membrane-bound ClpP family serine protease|nr:NfeD family protein [Prevotellaceae bacterium]
MDIVIITLLILAAIVLFLVELFLFHGTVFAGVCGLGCLIYANFYAYAYMGLWSGVVVSVVSAVSVLWSINRFMRSKTLDRISLKQEIDSTIDRSDALSLHIGDTGVSLTRLALIGSAEIGGKVVEVKSADGFLDEKTPLVVSRIEDGVIMVERQKK